MKKRTYAEKQQRMRQIFCLILAILMILGVMAAVIPYFALSVHAADADFAAIEAVTADSAENSIDQEEEPDIPLLLRIGLMFGSGVTPSFAISANNGFCIGAVDKNNQFTALYDLAETRIAVCRDSNLTRDEDGYYVSSSANVIIGGYHLELPSAYQTKEAAQAAVKRVNSALSAAGLYSSLVYAFPYYQSGSVYIRIGDFGSSDSASAKKDAIAAVCGETPSTVYPEEHTLTVLSPDKNLILMEYRADKTELGISALPSPDTPDVGNTIMTPAKNTYEGIFLFNRYNSGVSVTNLIELEQYVAGVLPYEINQNWKYEALKAFACVIRSFTLANRSKHASLGIDLCNGTDCQVYRGTGLQNEAVLNAVSETRGLVIAYQNKICSTIYSAVMGGCTVNVEQIWNGSTYPYLRAVETPWEDYASHPRGEWMTEVSPHDLYTYLAFTKGYTRLKGDIADVSIVQLAENSTYVYKLDITDIYGNTVSLKGTDIIRTTLGRYLNSANFVVGYKGEIPILNRQLTILTENGAAPLPVEQTDDKTTVQVLSADGIKELDITNGMEILTADGSTAVLSAEEAVYDIPENALERLTDADNPNFLFIGKGWGHGGGISQWGAKNLAENGAFYDEIIHSYFTDVEIKPFKECVCTP